MLKIGLHVTVNVALFILYIFLFGMQSFSKYFDNGVTIITHELKPLNMIPPGKFSKFPPHPKIENYILKWLILFLSHHPTTFTALSVFPTNLNTNTGFKIGSAEDCKDMDGELFINCMENRTFSANDIFPFERTNMEMKPYFFDGSTLGMVQSVKIEIGAISKNVVSSLGIKMNPNMSYFLVLTDQNLHATSNNIDVVPRTVMTLKNGGIANIVFKATISYIYPFLADWVEKWRKLIIKMNIMPFKELLSLKKS